MTRIRIRALADARCCQSTAALLFRLLVMVPVHYRQHGLMANASSPALTALGQDGDLAPPDAAAFCALLERHKMVMRLESEEWADLQLTGFDTSSYATHPRRLTMRLPRGTTEGKWDYVKTAPAHQARLEISFSGGPGVNSPGVFLTCNVSLLFSQPHEGRLPAGCHGLDTGQFPGGPGTFYLQSLF